MYLIQNSSIHYSIPADCLSSLTERCFIKDEHNYHNSLHCVQDCVETEFMKLILLLYEALLLRSDRAKVKFPYIVVTESNACPVSYINCNSATSRPVLAIEYQ